MTKKEGGAELAAADIHLIPLFCKTAKNIRHLSVPFYGIKLSLMLYLCAEVPFNLYQYAQRLTRP